MLKQAIRSIAPEPLVNRYEYTIEKRFLARVPQRKFKTSNLRFGSTLDVARVFSDPEIAAAWRSDHLALSRLYHEREMFLGVNPGDRRAIYSLIMALRPSRVLEVGTHIGASTIHIAAALEWLRAGGRMTTVDIVDVNDPEHGPWREAGMSQSPADSAKELGLDDRIDFVVSPSQAFMEATDQRFDFIFLDGSHGASTVYEEVSAALSLLNQDGVILLHDYYPDAKPLFPNGKVLAGPFLGMKRILQEKPNIEVLPLGALPWPTKLGTNMTTLALVAKRS